MSTSLSIVKGIAIPLSELKFKFSRSSGHGGQNVNKTETRVELLFDLRNSPGLSESHRDLVLQKLRSRIDENGILRIVAQHSRNQWRNRQEAIERFIELMRKALTPIRPRRATKPTPASKEKRHREKKRRGEIKSLRRIIE